jgi:hypothetical protein
MKYSMQHFLKFMLSETGVQTRAVLHPSPASPNLTNGQKADGFLNHGKNARTQILLPRA